MRIAGIDIPDNKRGEISLTYIFGLGKSSAHDSIATWPASPLFSTVEHALELPPQPTEEWAHAFQPCLPCRHAAKPALKATPTVAVIRATCMLQASVDSPAVLRELFILRSVNQ